MNNDEIPRVYVACLASYNAGILHGEWIDVPEDSDELMEEIEKMLKDSPVDDCEEWAIHDYEYFEPFKVHEYESLDTIVKYAQVIKEINDDGDLDAFKVWDDLDQDQEADEITENFRNAFMGTYSSPEDFAYEIYGHDIPKHLEYYIDYNAIWRDLEGDYTCFRDGQDCYIFSSCY